MEGLTFEDGCLRTSYTCIVLSNPEMMSLTTKSALLMDLPMHRQVLTALLGQRSDVQQHLSHTDARGKINLCQDLCQVIQNSEENLTLKCDAPWQVRGRAGISLLSEYCLEFPGADHRPYSRCRVVVEEASD